MPARMIIAMLVALLIPLVACTQDANSELSETTPQQAMSFEETPWESYKNAGLEALAQAHYLEAEESLLAALKEAEKFGDQDIRLATSLNNLANLYRAQGKHSEVEPLLQRALATYEKMVGPEHPYVALGLVNYAAFLREVGRNAEADKLEERATAIWAIAR